MNDCNHKYTSANRCYYCDTPGSLPTVMTAMTNQALGGSVTPAPPVIVRQTKPWEAENGKLYLALDMNTKLLDAFLFMRTAIGNFKAETDKKQRNLALYSSAEWAKFCDDYSEAANHLINIVDLMNTHMSKSSATEVPKEKPSAGTGLAPLLAALRKP